MVVKARDDVTVATLNDVAMVLPYYLTQSNTASAPATPTTNPPTGGWTNAEPTYNSSNTVYMSFPFSLNFLSFSIFIFINKSPFFPPFSPFFP